MIYCPECGSETYVPRSKLVKRVRVCVSCATATDYKQPHMCECGNPKNRRSPGCPRCMELDHDRISGETRRKVLAAVSHLDWATTGEVCVAMDVAGQNGPEYRKAACMLRRLLSEGVLETRGDSTATEYRLVQRKRRAA
jgi:hypothetical protein